MPRGARFVAVLAVAAALGGCWTPGEPPVSPTGGSIAGTTADELPPPGPAGTSSTPAPTGTPGPVMPSVEPPAASADANPPFAGPAVPSAGPAVPVPVFTSSVVTVGPDLAARMGASWRPGCPVPLEDLRYVTVSHVDFDGAVQAGELVVHADVADAVVQVFADLFAADDTRSMDADNTSAFNCRAVTGGSAWSEHAYGRAIDLNPVENPYVLGSHVAPAQGRAYVDRPQVPGVIHADDVVVRAFSRVGWTWGGTWTRPIDYQHFSVSGR